MKGKTCVITGATSGIGRAAALKMGQLGADLILVGRNERVGADLARRLGRTHARGNARFLRADLVDQHDVRKLAAEIARSCERIDVLVNNAGTRFDTYRATPDAIEATFATNHLSYFLLTVLLLERLRSASAARVITVASGAHSGASGDFERTIRADSYDRKTAYAESKLANVMFAYELARRLRGPSVSSNAVDPGGVATNLGRNNGLLSWKRWYRVFGQSCKVKKRLTEETRHEDEQAEAEPTRFPQGGIHGIILKTAVALAGLPGTVV